MKEVPSIKVTTAVLLFVMRVGVEKMDVDGRAQARTRWGEAHQASGSCAAVVFPHKEYGTIKITSSIANVNIIPKV